MSLLLRSAAQRSPHAAFALRLSAGFLLAFCIVALMATSARADVLLGDSTTTAATGWTASAGQADGYQFTAAATGAVKDIELRTNGAANTATSVRFGIYADNGSTRPGALLGAGTYGAKPPVNAWVRAAGLSVNVTKGTRYWLVYQGVGGNVHFNYTDGSTIPEAWRDSLTSLPSPFGTPSGTYTVSRIGFRANGTAAAATPTPPAPVPAPATSACPTGSHQITGGSIATGVGATAAGGTLCLNGGTYSASAPVVVTKAVRILGVNGATVNGTFNDYLFKVRAANVTIEGLSMRGANRNRTGESCSGTGAVRVDGYAGAKVLRNTITTMTCGITLAGSSSFEVRGNKLSQVRYTGINTQPATNGVIDGNTVTDVDHDGPLGENAYGIVASGNLSRSIMISNNTVRNAPTWECFDTHDGQSIDFVGNTCVAPGRAGINVITTGISTPNGRVSGNTVDAGGLRSAWNSIAYGGTGSVTSNVIKGFGSCLIWAPSATQSGNSCS